MTRNAATRRSEHRLFQPYREWLGGIGAVCVVSGRPAEDLCHLREFTGAAMKPPPWHCLPLAREYHNRQESLGVEFFRLLGIADPIREAEELFAFYHAREMIAAAEWASARLREICARVNRAKLKELMA